MELYHLLWLIPVSIFLAILPIRAWSYWALSKLADDQGEESKYVGPTGITPGGVPWEEK